MSVKELKVGVEISGLRVGKEDEKIYDQFRALLKEKKLLFVKGLFADLEGGGQQMQATKLLQSMQDLAQGIAGDEVDASVLNLNPFAAKDPSCATNFPRIRALGIAQCNQDSVDTARTEQKPLPKAQPKTCCCFAWWQRRTTPQGNPHRFSSKVSRTKKNAEEKSQTKVLENFLCDSGIQTLENTSTRGMEWHTDGIGITILYAHILPKTLMRRTWFVDSNKVLTALSLDQQAVVRRLRQVIGPDRTMEAAVGCALERGAQMNELGTRLERPIPASWLSMEELRERETGWVGNAKRWSHLQGSLVKRNMSTANEHGSSSADVLFVNPMHLVRFEEPELSEATQVFQTVGKDTRKSHSSSGWSEESGKSEAGKTKEESMKEKSGELSSAVLAAILEPGINQHAYAHYWEEGDAAIFDNRQLLHSADNLQSSTEPHLMLQIFVKCTTSMTELP